MKKLTFGITIFLFSIGIIFSQESKFKEVKTAQDVIDNYMTSNGGKENLMKVKSFKVSATAGYGGEDYPLNMYISSSIFYMDFKSSVFNFTIAYDGKNKEGWSKYGDKVTDMKKEQLDLYQLTVESSLWKYYYDKDKYGIAYQLLENEKVDGKETYVVDFKKGEYVVYTVYYDTANYHRLKQVSPNTTSTFEDFREVDDTGIIMPFKITNEQTSLKILKYEFNQKFDKDLLEKP